jgi:hypothetical protein
MRRGQISHEDCQSGNQKTARYSKPWTSAQTKANQDKANQERMSLRMEQTNQPIFGAREPIHEEAALPVFNPQAIAGANLTEVAHEARNMVAALGLYCDLLSEPGVLSATHQHYGSELKMVPRRAGGLSTG